MIEFLTPYDAASKDIHQILYNVYEVNAPSKTSVKKWAAKFKHWQASIEDDPTRGPPVGVRTSDKCYAAKRLVMNDR